MNQAGIFAVSKVNYSESTKDLLKDLLREASVNTEYLRRIKTDLKNGKGICEYETQENIPHKKLKKIRKSSNGGYRKRSKNAIVEMGCYELDQHYVPPPPKYGPGAKQRCQDLMEFRGDISTAIVTSRVIRECHDEDVEVDRGSELLRDMEERVEWLSAMDAIGKGHKHRPLIINQLAIKLRDLELIDQENESKMNH